MTPPNFLVLRHGQTVWNNEGRLQGGLDSPLTDMGRAQAVQQRDIVMSSVGKDWPVFSSPMGRALMTAQIVCGRQIGKIATDARLAEIDMGIWAGRLVDDVLRDLQADGHNVAAPLELYNHCPGEALQSLHDRCESFLHDLDEPAVIITHGITSRMLRVVALGVPLSDFAKMPGGQGVVHAVFDAQHVTLAANKAMENDLFMAEKNKM